MYLKFSLFNLIILSWSPIDSAFIDSIKLKNTAQKMEALNFKDINVIHNKKIGLVKLFKYFSHENNFFTKVQELNNLDSKREQAELNLLLPESEITSCDTDKLIKLFKMHKPSFTTVCFGDDIYKFEKLLLEKMNFTTGFWFLEMKSGQFFHIQLLNGLFVKNAINTNEAVSGKELEIDQKGAVLKCIALPYSPWLNIEKCDGNNKNCEGK